MKRMKKWMSALLALLLLASLSVPSALAAGLKYEAKEEVNLRKGPGVEYTILTSVPKGDVVTVTGSTSQLWWAVTYTKNKKTYKGYINSTYLKPSKKNSNEEKKNTAPLGCYFTTVSQTLYAGPGTSYTRRTTVPVNNLVNVTDTTDTSWFKVDFIDKTGTKYKAGWLNAKYLKKAAEPYNVKSATELRKKAKKSAKALCSLPKGAYVSVTGSSGKYWYKLSYTDINGETFVGYALKSKLKKGTVTNKPYKQVDPDAGAKKLAELWLKKPRYVVTAKSKLYSKANKKGKKLADVPKNSVVAVTNTSNKKWYKVIYNDAKNKKKEGYLPKSALKKYVDPNAGTYVTKVDTQLRRTDSQTGAVIAEIPQYTLIEVTDSSEKDWYLVVYKDEEGENHKGFVYCGHAQKYEETKAGTYVTKVDAQLREAASDTAEVIRTVPAGSLVEVRKTYNPDWYLVSYNDGEGTTNGFIYSGYLRQRENGNELYVSKVDTPLRKLPKDTADPELMVPEKQTVTVMDKGFGSWWWAKYVDANGVVHTGYVYGSHLMSQAEFDAQNAQVQPQSDEPEDEPEEAPEQAEPAEESRSEGPAEEPAPAESEQKEQTEDKSEDEQEEQTEEKSEEKQEEQTEEKSEEKQEEQTEEKSEEKQEEQTEEKSEEKQKEQTEDKPEGEQDQEPQAAEEDPELEAAA